MRQVNQEELARADGRAGRAALVAVDGKVYDVSSSKLWADGAHMNAHRAGGDMSQEILTAPHSHEVLTRVSLVGELAGPGPRARPAESPRPPTLVARVLAIHPHPVSVHFPIALSLSGAFFLVLSLLLGKPPLERAALYNLSLAALASPAAIAAGLVSWRYNYGSTWTPLFRAKAVLSVVVAALAFGAAIMRWTLPDVFGPSGAWQWMYVLPVLALGATVPVLGYLGGRVTFPR